jgi:hypothetical protein
LVEIGPMKRGFLFGLGSLLILVVIAEAAGGFPFIF